MEVYILIIPVVVLTLITKQATYRQFKGKGAPRGSSIHSTFSHVITEAGKKRFHGENTPLELVTGQALLSNVTFLGSVLVRKHESYLTLAH